MYQLFMFIDYLIITSGALITELLKPFSKPKWMRGEKVFIDYECEMRLFSCFHIITFSPITISSQINPDTKNKEMKKLMPFILYPLLSVHWKKI